MFKRLFTKPKNFVSLKQTELIVEVTQGVDVNLTNAMLSRAANKPLDHEAEATASV